MKNFQKQDSKESSPRSLDKMLLELQVNSQNVHNTQWSKFFKKKSSKFLKCYKIQIMSNHNPKILIHMIQNDAIISKDFKLVLNPYDAI